MHKGKFIKVILPVVVMFCLFFNSFTIDFSALFSINPADRQFIKIDNKVWAQDFDPAETASPFTTAQLYTMVRMIDGTVKACGKNNYGQLGLGDTVDRYTFTDIPNLTGVKQIANIEQSSTFALMNDGTVKSWGRNDRGQLGQGDTTPRKVPKTISGLTGVKQLVTSPTGYYIFALLSDGTVKSWGYNVGGNLGVGDTTDRYTPTTIPGLTGVKQIVAGVGCDYALMEDGTVKTWGWNQNGSLGTGDSPRATYVPIAIPGLTGVMHLVAGYHYALALMDDGTVKSWGDNFGGCLGLGDTTNRYTPSIVPGLIGVKQLATSLSGYYSFAIMNDGSVKAWGDNENYDLGFGDTTDRYFPTTVPGLTGVTQLIAGG